MKPDEEQALHEFLTCVRRHYGARLLEVVLFGSRARGDARPDSDADLAVILDDGEWRFWAEKKRLADMSYEAQIEAGPKIQAWPIARSEWEDPARHRNRAFVEAIKRDARKLPAAA